MPQNCKHAPCKYLIQVGEHFICKKDSLQKDRYPTISTIRSYDISCNDFEPLEKDEWYCKTTVGTCPANTVIRT